MFTAKNWIIASIYWMKFAAVACEWIVRCQIHSTFIRYEMEECVLMFAFIPNDTQNWKNYRDFLWIGKNVRKKLNKEKPIDNEAKQIEIEQNELKIKHPVPDWIGNGKMRRKMSACSENKTYVHIFSMDRWRWSTIWCADRFKYVTI